MTRISFSGTADARLWWIGRYISAVMESGYFGKPVQGLANAAGLGVLHGHDPVPFAPGNRCHDRVDGRDKDERFALQFQGKLVGEGALGPERDDRHRFTMQSIRVSVIFWPSAQNVPRWRLFCSKNARKSSGSCEPTIAARSPADERQASSTSGTYGFCWRMSA